MDIPTKEFVRTDKFAEARRLVGMSIQNLVPWIRNAAVVPRPPVACFVLPSIAAMSDRISRRAEPLPG